MKQFNVAILGATGAVGREMLKILEEYDFPVKELRPLASARSAGTTVPFKGQEILVQEATEQSFEGMLLKIDGVEIWSRLIGLHNAYNLLALYTTAITLGAKQEEALTAISTLAPAPGRLENIRGPRDISVIIDYAHTPDALENVLKTLREIAHLLIRMRRRPRQDQETGDGQDCPEVLRQDIRDFRQQQKREDSGHHE